MYFDVFEALAPTVLDGTARILEVIGLFNLPYPLVVVCVKARRYVFNQHFQKSPLVWLRPQVVLPTNRSATNTNSVLTTKKERWCVGEDSQRPCHKEE
jgi:hypothetical protein